MAPTGAASPHKGVNEMVDIKEISMREKKNRVKWGFFWASICAVLWGLGYVPLALLLDPNSTVMAPVIAHFPEDATLGYIVGDILVSVAQPVMFAVVLTFLWAGVTGKLKEEVRTFTHFKITKWLLIGALFGGPLAIFGTAMATTYVGAAFAGSIALLSAAVGATVARVVYKEKMSRNTILGIVLLLIGGVILLNPVSMWQEISAGTLGNAWLGYLGGIASAIGWGLEGNFAIRALDVTDADTSLPIRFAWEAIVWLVVLLPITAMIIGIDTFAQCVTASLTGGSLIFWMLLCSLTLGMCYVAQYKAFPLLGIGRTLSINNLYVVVMMVALSFFLGAVPEAWIWVGAIIAVLGTFVMYRDSGSLTESTRDVTDPSGDTGGVKS